MDLALFAIIISAVVLVLQIVTLSLIAGTRKAVADLKSVPQVAPSQSDRDRQGRRDNEFRRHDRRPFHDQRQRPQQQQQQSPAAPQPASATAGEGIEKSLRDINLRLKNAERDQESARRRMQENLPRDHQQPRDQQQFRSRDDRNRDDRDRGRSRGGRDRHDRHGNRDQRRGNWQERRDRMDRPMQQASQAQATPAPQTDASADDSLFEPKNQPAIESAAPVVEIPPTAPAAQEDTAVDFGSEEGLQHGRKIIVKRRPLSTGEPSDALEPAANNASDPAVPEAETASGNDDASDTEIKFGRR